jgi:hypothetical protein
MLASQRDHVTLIISNRSITIKQVRIAPSILTLG